MTPNDFTAEELATYGIEPGDAPQVPDDVLNGSDGTEQLPKPISAWALSDQYPHLHEPIIDGLLLRGETMNIIAAPKVVKSWLAYGQALSVATGEPWLNRFHC